MYTLIASGYGIPPKATLKTYGFSSDSNPMQELSSLSIINPSFVCTSSNTLYTLSECSDQATISLYPLDHQKNLPLSELTLDGGDLCYLSYSPRHETLFGACYQTGHIFSLKVHKDTSLELKSSLRLTPSEDGISRAHCTQMDPEEHYLYATNIHTDRIYCYQVHEGTLIPNKDFLSLALPKGHGPRHIIFHPTLPIGYIITEYSNKIFVISQDKSTGSLTILQEIDTLTSDFIVKSYCSNCIITPNLKYLLATNRGANSITTFTILQDGTLALKTTASCEGNWPRHIACTHDGNYLMICNQKSHQIVVSHLDVDEGVIGPIAHIIPFHEPSYVQEMF